MGLDIIATSSLERRAYAHKSYIAQRSSRIATNPMNTFNCMFPNQIQHPANLHEPKSEYTSTLFIQRNPLFHTLSQKNTITIIVIIEYTAITHTHKHINVVALSNNRCETST